MDIVSDFRSRRFDIFRRFAAAHPLIGHLSTVENQEA
jgi:hypothetical protein